MSMQQATPPPALPTIFEKDGNMESYLLGAPLVESNESRSTFHRETRDVPGSSNCHAAGIWKPEMSLEERRARRQWLSGGRRRKGLRIMIVTENFLPKVDGVTRTLARLLSHLEAQGHECMVLGPQTGMSHYASHPLVGTLGLPLILYPGLKLNFLRPRFLNRLQDWEPDVVHFVDPIWLGGQTMIAMEKGWAGSVWDKKSKQPCRSEQFQGAVVASYHTNIATYATLFGLPWLEPIIWKWQGYLLSKCSLTMCPSPSTAAMLHSKRIEKVRTWPRGVDLPQLYPVGRCEHLRRTWGIQSVPIEGAPKVETSKTAHPTTMEMPLTPPATPVTSPVDAINNASNARSERLVALFVSRMSWEKNLLLLIKALEMLPAHLPLDTEMPKMVFVGHGPAKAEIERLCQEKGIDAAFMGYQEKEELARSYASADFFCFPSFTETFGQVVLEALAFGLPVIGLDADGTRDLVKSKSTGLLLPLPGRSGASTTKGWSTMRDWHEVCKDSSSPVFLQSADGYARMIAKVMSDHDLRRNMSRTACTKGVEGYTWGDAMERCVDGYREALKIRIAEEEAVLQGKPPGLSESRSLSEMSPFDRNQLIIRRFTKLLVLVIVVFFLARRIGL